MYNTHKEAFPWKILGIKDSIEVTIYIYGKFGISLTLGSNLNIHYWISAWRWGIIKAFMTVNFFLRTNNQIKREVLYHLY